MIATLPHNKWRSRLRNLVEKSGRSKRDISIQAGLGQGYVHELLTTSKEPSVTNLSAVAAQLEISLAELLA